MMKRMLLSLSALIMLAGIAAPAEAQYTYHHRHYHHRSCTIRHHHRVCRYY